MYNDNSIRLGVVPTMRIGFDSDATKKNHKNIIDKVRELSSDNIEIFNLDWLNERGVIFSRDDIDKVVKYMAKKEVDAIFIPHVNFGEEETVAFVAKKLGVPVLLWGPRDLAPTNINWRDTDTQCGLFATSKALQRLKVPFTYIENCWIEEEKFKNGYLDFLRTVAIVKKIKNMKIAQIGQRPLPFMSVIYNESELLEKFGIQVLPVNITSVVDRVNKKLENNKMDVKEQVEMIKKKVDIINDDTSGSLDKMAALKLAYMDIADELKLDAIGSECWTVYGKALQIAPCFVYALLNDDFLPIGCETDVLSSISQGILSAASYVKEPTFCADLTIRHPDNDNAELIWHCGPFPVSLAKKNEQKELKQFKGYYRLKDGDLTVARFDSINGEYKLFAGEGRSVDGPRTNGGYLWLETDNWPKWEEKFIKGPYIHHVALVYGKYANVIEEACNYFTDLKYDKPGM